MRRLRRLAGRAVDPSRAPRAKARTLEVVSRSSVLTALWYLPRRSYRQEQRAMLAGIARYHRAEAVEGPPPVYRLRRAIHRIEKGLVAAPRRPVFAEDYINETVAAYDRVVRSLRDGSSEVVDTAFVGWATDVLDSYFDVAGSTPTIDRARQRYAEIHDGLHDELAGPAGAIDRSGGRVPKPKDGAPPPVAFDDLLALARRRRSVRRFRPDPVPRELLDRAVEVARQSPSACNRQAFEFRLYDDAALAAAIAGIAPGFDPGDRPPPCMVVITGKYRAYYRERDQHVIYVDASLASMSLVLAAEALGLASCCINWPSIPDIDRRMSDLLGLAPDEEVIMLMALGFADAEHSSPFSEKMPLDAIRSYNRRGPG